MWLELFFYDVKWRVIMFGLSKKGKQIENNISSKSKCVAIIVAAGNGTRMKSEGSKQFITILGNPLISYTLKVFEDCNEIDEIVIVAREADIIEMKDIAEAFEITKVKKIVSGGETRQASVYSGLCAVPNDAEIVVIHDGARPFIKDFHLKAVIEETKLSGAAAVGVKVKDSIKKVDINNYITNTIDREYVWAIQTPQSFTYSLIMKAYEFALENNVKATDDTELARVVGAKAKMLEGSYDNIKVTSPDDIYIAERILGKKGDKA